MNLNLKIAFKIIENTESYSVKECDFTKSILAHQVYGFDIDFGILHVYLIPGGYKKEVGTIGMRTDFYRLDPCLKMATDGYFNKGYRYCYINDFVFGLFLK